MIIVGGMELCGKVCHIPGVCFIATRFICISGFPIVPEESFLIIDIGDRKRGIKVPLHRGSILFAYLHAISAFLVIIPVIPLIFFFYMGAPKGLEGYGPVIRNTCCITLLVGLGFFLLMPYLARHSKPQARTILARAGIDQALIDRLLALPDLPSDEALARFSADQARNQTKREGRQINEVDQRLTPDIAPFSNPVDRSNRSSKDTQS